VSPSGRERIALSGLAGLVLFLHRGALVAGGVMFKRDVHLIWVPQIEGFVRAVLGGAWPVWDPCPAFGQPLLADPGAQVLYPLTWLNLLMRPWTYFTVYSVFHSLLAAFGVYRLARHFGASIAGAFVAGALWTASGPFVSLVDLWHHYAGTAWIPWVFLTVVRALEAPAPRRIAAAGLVLALQIVAGSADLCAMTLLAIGSYTAVFRLDWRAPFALANRRLVGAGAAVLALGMGLSAALWMTALELITRTPRWSLPAGIRTYWSVHPLGALQILFPGLWTDAALSPALREALFESREPFLFSLYLGLPCLALIAGGLALQPSPIKRYWLGFAAAVLLIALGRHFVLYDLVVFVIPPLRILRYPVKALALLGLAWALLAGLGFDAWRQPSIPDRRRFRLAVLLPLLLVALGGLAATLVLRSEPQVWGPRVVARAADGPPYRTLLASTTSPFVAGLVLASVCAVIAIARARRPTATGWATALAVVAIGDLALFHRDSIPFASRDLYNYRPPVVDALRQMRAERLYVYDYTQLLASRTTAGAHGPELASVPKGWSIDAAFALGLQQLLAPQTAGRWDLRSGFEIDYRGLQPGYLTRLTAVVRELGRDPRLRLLRLGAVTHAVALDAFGLEGLAPVGSWDTVLKDPVRVLQVPDPLARARVVGGARIGDDIEGLEALLDSGFDPAREILLPAGSPQPPPAEAAGTVRILEERSDRIVLEAQLAAPAYVVLADAFDPGWQGTLDGVPAPILRANLAFRAVRVSAGRHRIEMVYRPRVLLAGLAISATTLLVALGLLTRPNRT
jgi:Bacterial membrane protein YfhO